MPSASGRTCRCCKMMGFGISEFGGDTFLVDALPTCIGDAFGVGPA